MVSIQHITDTSDINTWLNTITPHCSSDEQELLRQACLLAEPLYIDKLDLAGKPLLQHALGAASILLGMNMSADILAATILHAVPAWKTDWKETIQASFGDHISELVEGISRIERVQQFNEIRGLNSKAIAKSDLESLRKMLLAMVSDIRVVLIKLAERAQTLRNLASAAPEVQKQIASETRSLFAPLANRLGVWQIKWELEDLSIRYLEPELYRKIAKLLDERRVDREQYIANVLEQLRSALQQANIKAELMGRPKHIYSIINKMKLKNLDFHQLYDVRALRILVEEVGECYAALDVVHSLWQPISSEYDDYIARPKSNNYRSLHTAVLGPRDLPLEVQIRTHEMHYHSELGVAAHWRYKEGIKSNSQFDEKIAWLRQILEWKNDLSQRSELQAQFKDEQISGQVYVLTPQGKVIDLPQGATPIDFAYMLHTSLGHRTRGAKVDGKIVPLTYTLQNAQRVEILTTKQGGPSRDWMNPALGFLHSNQARAKVRAWFNQQHLSEHIAQGKVLLERELNRVGIEANLEKLAQRLNHNKVESFLAAIGKGDITLLRVNRALQEEYPHKFNEISKPVVFKPTPNQKPGKADIVVGGQNNLVTRMAKCCDPKPPHEIVAYITRDRGITIHQSNCKFISELDDYRKNKVLSARWEG